MDRHSIIVRGLQVILPIAAAAILFGVFFIDWSTEEEVTAQFDETDAEFVEAHAQMSNPTLTTTNAEGDEISIEAEVLVQETASQDVVNGEVIDGVLNVGGSEWDIQSDKGQANTGGTLAEFSGRVLALVDGEYNFSGSQVIADITSRTFTSNLPLEIRSERFDIDADRATMTGELGNRVIELEGRVKGVVRLEVQE